MAPKMFQHDHDSRRTKIRKKIRSRQIMLLLFMLTSTITVKHNVVLVDSFSLDSTRIPGIWKLTTQSLPYGQQDTDIRSQLLQGLSSSSSSSSSPSSSNGNDKNNRDKTILLKLNSDGTFKQCNEGYKEGRWISGCWKLDMDASSASSSSSSSSKNSSKDQETTRKLTQRLILAMHRQYFGPSFDLILDGRWINNNNNNNASVASVESTSSSASASPAPASLVVQGTVQKGKYLHPQSHPSFFDTPMLANVDSLGPFTLEQSLSTHTILGTDSFDSINFDLGPSSLNGGGSGASGTEGDISSSSLYGKRFLMTIEPLEEPKTMKAAMKTSDRPIDIRSMPIDFFSNNTFAAYGNNKILRGRFQVKATTAASTASKPKSPSSPSSSATQNPFKLLMDVSLFGAGRSAPGSVYSEGLGLTHDDEQSYVGEIQWERQTQSSKSKSKSKEPSIPVRPNDVLMLFAHGTAFYGTDLGEDARPEPCGRFTLVQDSSFSATTQKDTETTQDTETAGQEDGTNDNSFSYCGGVFE